MQVYGRPLCCNVHTLAHPSPAQHIRTTSSTALLAAMRHTVHARVVHKEAVGGQLALGLQYNAVPQLAHDLRYAWKPPGSQACPGSHRQHHFEGWECLLTNLHACPVASVEHGYYRYGLVSCLDSCWLCMGSCRFVQVSGCSAMHASGRTRHVCAALLHMERKPRTYAYMAYMPQLEWLLEVSCCPLPSGKPLCEYEVNKT